MGDWNAVVGEGEPDECVGQNGLGERNNRGERLVEFCKQQQMLVTNTCFKQDKRRRYTWKAPGDTGRYQLDYILEDSGTVLTTRTLIQERMQTRITIW